MAQTETDPARALGRRLRELRESRFPGVTITQKALGKALGGDQPISAPLISTWEKGTATPPRRRLAAYATFFATSRSIEGSSPRLLPDNDLDAAEQAERDALHRDLMAMREAARREDEEAGQDQRPLGGSWHFSDGAPVRIMCTAVPAEQLNPEATPEHPKLAYGELYSYSSIDALLELHGHIRAANPHSDVRIRKYHDMKPDDFSAHLVVLGGVDWNPFTVRIQEMVRDLPIRQVSGGADPSSAVFEVSNDKEVKRYGSELTRDGELDSDVGLFLRIPSPFNQARTLTVCNAMYSLGTLGVVRALTDIRFRDRNEDYVRTRFGRGDAYGILTRVLIVNGRDALTPDWTAAQHRLYEWQRA